MKTLRLQSEFAKKRFQTNHRKTGIIATLGKNKSPELIGDLVAQGVNVFRLNYSAHNPENDLEALENIKRYLGGLQKRRVIGTMLEIKGAKSTTSPQAVEEISFEPEHVVTIKSVPNSQLKAQISDINTIYVDYLDLCKNVKEGDRLSFEEGHLQGSILEVYEDYLKMRVKSRGTLKEYSKLQIPGINLNLPKITESNKNEFEFGVQNKVDYFSVSNIADGNTIREVKEMVNGMGGRQKILAKVDSSYSYNNIDSIIKESDGVIIARGELGGEIPRRSMFHVQKDIITKCNLAGVPVVTSTQLLDSMRTCPYPTRAECTDVANAVLDGTDALMLLQETSEGQYPALTTQIMKNICLEVEREIDYEGTYDNMWHGSARPMMKKELIAATCVRLAYEIDAKLICVFTSGGTTARFVSKYRPMMPVVALSPSLPTGRSLGILRGVIPRLVESRQGQVSLETLVRQSFNEYCANGFITPNPPGENYCVCIFDSNSHENYESANNIHFFNF